METKVSKRITLEDNEEISISTKLGVVSLGGSKESIYISPYPKTKIRISALDEEEGCRIVWYKEGK